MRNQMTVAPAGWPQLFQYTTAPRSLDYGDQPHTITASIRFDDECSNGHASCAITADIKRNGRYVAGGCCHDEIRLAFPELAPFISWHLSGTDGPMHYIANAKYWYGASGYCDGKPSSPPNMAHFKSAICYGALDSDAEQLSQYIDKADAHNWAHIESLLFARKDTLLAAFRTDMEKLGGLKNTLQQRTID